MDDLIFIFLFHCKDNPLTCDCDILWLKQWLSNPHNRESLNTAADEHRCETPDRKHHVITELKDEDFNCEKRHGIDERKKIVSYFDTIIYETNS